MVSRPNGPNTALRVERADAQWTGHHSQSFRSFRAMLPLYNGMKETGKVPVAVMSQDVVCTYIIWIWQYIWSLLWFECSYIYLHLYLQVQAEAWKIEGEFLTSSLNCSATFVSPSVLFFFPVHPFPVTGSFPIIRNFLSLVGVYAMQGFGFPYCFWLLFLSRILPAFILVPYLWEPSFWCHCLCFVSISQLVHILWVLNLGWNPPYIMRSSLHVWFLSPPLPLIILTVVFDDG